MSPSLTSVVRRLRFHQLELLKVIAERGTLTAAADDLHISVAAASKSLAEVELLFGQTLFHRSVKGLRPTLDGARVLMHVRLLLNELQHMLDGLGSSRHAPASRLRLGMPPYIMETVGPGLLKTLLDRLGPGVSYAIAPGNWLRMLIEELLEGELDAVITLYSQPAVEELDLSRLVIDDLRDEPMVVVAPAAMAQGLADAPSWRDVAGMPWIMPPGQTHTRRTIDEAFSVAGCPLPRPTVECPGLLASMSLAVAGVGLAVAPLSAARAEIAAGRLAALRSLQLPATRLVLVHRPVAMMSLPALMEAREVLLEVFGDA